MEETCSIHCLWQLKQLFSTPGTLLMESVVSSHLIKLTQTFFLRIPNVTVSTDEGDVELEISDDPHDCRRLDVTSLPVTVTLSKVGRV